MKKTLLSLSLLLFVMAAFSQDTAGVKRTEEYCLIIGTQQMFSTKVSVQIDYGQQRKFFEDTRYKDEQGNLVKFNSMIDALNYMNSQGWVFMNAYPMISNAGTAYHYLMRRTIKESEAGR